MAAKIANIYILEMVYSEGGRTIRNDWFSQLFDRSSEPGEQSSYLM